MQVHLAQALGLQPLDRVQINDRAAREAFWLDARHPEAAELPFWYFQRVDKDGRLELASPGGRLVRVQPNDVCDVRRAEPVLVQAMPKSVFMERSRIPVAERQGAVPPSCYAPAHVLRVVKDRWNRVDMVFVRFVDPGLNVDEPWAAPLKDGERMRLQGIAREHERFERAATTFLRAALRGNQAVVGEMSCLDASMPRASARRKRGVGALPAMA